MCTTFEQIMSDAILCVHVCPSLAASLLGFCLFWQPAIFHISLVTSLFYYSDWQMKWW